MEKLDVPNFPKDETKGKHSVETSKVIYVDRSDVREVDSPKFYGIAPGKRVGLKYSYIVKITGIQKEGDKIVKVTAEIDSDVILLLS